MTKATNCPSILKRRYLAIPAFYPPLVEDRISRMTEAAYITAVTEALAPEVVDAFHLDGEAKPWQFLYCQEIYEFKTPEEAIAKARKLQAMA